VVFERRVKVRGNYFKERQEKIERKETLEARNMRGTSIETERDVQEGQKETYW